jgi:hypothetical protein
MPGVEQRIQAVEKRLQHLEAMVEGLQDSVHREAVRHEEQIGELQKSTEPGTIRRALDKDARERGI